MDKKQRNIIKRKSPVEIRKKVIGSRNKYYKEMMKLCDQEITLERRRKDSNKEIIEKILIIKQIYKGYIVNVR